MSRLQFVCKVALLAFLCQSVLCEDGAKIMLLARTIDTNVDPGVQVRETSSSENDKMGLFLVQFKRGHMKVADKEPVEKIAGSKLGSYLPDYAFAILAPWGKVGDLKAVDSVHWVGEFLPEYKLSPGVKSGDFGKGDTITFYILNSFSDNDKTTEKMQSVVSRWRTAFPKCQFEAASKAKATASCPAKSAEAAVKFLSEQPEVQWIEVAPSYTIMDPSMATAIKQEQVTIM